MAPIRRSERIQRRQEAAGSSGNVSIAAVAPVVESRANNLAEPERGTGLGMTINGAPVAASVHFFRFIRNAAGLQHPENVSEECRRRATTILLRELQNFKRNPLQNCTVELDEENIFRWNVTILGTPDTPYEDGVFHLALVFPGDYPVSPPYIFFKTKIFHCNISKIGSVCMDIIQDKWNPLQTVQSTIVYLQLLLAEPNPDGAFKPSVGALCKNEREQYDAKARAWTKRYAKP